MLSILHLRLVLLLYLSLLWGASLAPYSPGWLNLERSDRVEFSDEHHDRNTLFGVSSCVFAPSSITAHRSTGCIQHNAKAKQQYNSRTHNAVPIRDLRYYCPMRLFYLRIFGSNIKVIFRKVIQTPNPWSLLVPHRTFPSLVRRYQGHLQEGHSDFQSVIFVTAPSTRLFYLRIVLTLLERLFHLFLSRLSLPDTIT